MSNIENFAVSRFKNRTGTTSWRVNGWLHGLRIRRNFKTREEAAAEKSVYEIKALQAAAGLHAVATILSEDQVREGEAVYRRLAGSAHTLSSCVDFALAHYRRPEDGRLLAEAIAEYVAAKQHELEQGHFGLPIQSNSLGLEATSKPFPRPTCCGYPGVRTGGVLGGGTSGNEDLQQSARDSVAVL